MVGNILIETPRLFIRRFREEDGPALYAYLSNPEIYRFEPGEPISLETARDLALVRSQGQVYWAVALKPADTLIGHLYLEQTEPVQFQTWELGYIFNPAYHNQGYASESAAALVRWGFRELGIHRVEAFCSPANTPSWKVMERIGMKREGLKRKDVFFRRDASGEPIWMDSYAYGLLEEDVEPG